jgi:hypothetical protein
MAERDVTRTRVPVRRDVAAGLLVCVLGVAIAAGASDLRIGTPARMGPGFLPLGLGILLTIIGGRIALAALHHGEPLPAFVRPRALVVLVMAFIAFALLIESAGLMIAAVAAVFIASFATPGRRRLEAALYAAALAAFAYLVFILLLEMPLQVWP